MCGIVGAVAQRDVLTILLDGLNRLGYRGYDSAGVALLNQKTGELKRCRVLGKVTELEEALKQSPVSGNVGIAHTRWATHGVPSSVNAHPHMSGNSVALVHNGIIENYESIRDRLSKKGYTFESDTDSEVIVHLIHDELKTQDDLLPAVHAAVNQLEGAFALGIIHQDYPNRLIAVRRGSPLVVGLGLGEHFIASDSLALLGVTQRFVYLGEGDFADLRLNDYALYDAQLKPIDHPVHESALTHDLVDKGNYRHYMLKEIFEQPNALTDTLSARINHQHVLPNIFGAESEAIFKQAVCVQIVACGTSYHAGLVASFWLEQIARIPCRVDIASEFRYRDVISAPNTLLVTISQSGETADTLAALRLAKKSSDYFSSLVICNVPESSLVRESDLVFMTRAGTEIGVASTKAFTTQLCGLFLLSLCIARVRGLSEEKESGYIHLLHQLPSKIEQALDLYPNIKKLASLFRDKQHTLFLGRGIEFPVALEGALKLKEISYIHAEAYPAGELKHGPLALVDDQMPVIMVIANDALFDKVKSNLEEVRARGGQVIVFIDESLDCTFDDDVTVIKLPAIDGALMPILATVPLQLLAYRVAVLKGTDVDQPRNLAKSVTVE